MGNSIMPRCPHCQNTNIVRNGHPHNGKLQLYCHTCHKYFSEDTAKGFPPTNIPFPVIAYVLYFHKKIPHFSNMRKLRKFTSQWLKCLGFRDTDVTRQLLHHWIKHYEKDIETIISFKEAREYCRKILSKNIEYIPYEDVISKTTSHTDTLQILKDLFGQQYCSDLLQKDKVFFDELCDLISKYHLYCQRLLERKQIVLPRHIFLGGASGH